MSSIVVPDKISVAERPRFATGYATFLFLIILCLLKWNSNFQDMGTPMVPTLGSQGAAQQWKNVSQKRRG